MVTRDALNYRKMTDKTVPTPGEKEEAALEEKELKVADIVKLSKGRGIMDDMHSTCCFIVGNALLDEMHNTKYSKIYVLRKKTLKLLLYARHKRIFHFFS